MMQKSSAYPPLDGLLDLACRDGVDIRPTLLRVLTDLYVQKPAHNAYEETQYVELARGLISAVDASTRAAVSASLRNYPAAPKAILEALAGTPGTSAPSTSAIMPEPQAAAQAAPDDLADLFFAATASERRLILANLDVVGVARLQPVTAPHEIAAQLEVAALQRNPEAFSRTLERALGIERRVAERIAHDTSGEALVVVAKGIGMKAALLQRILLFLNPAIGQSIERVYDLANLFDELSSQAAAHMLSTWRKPVTRNKPAHEPALFDDERRGARAAATPGRYAAPNRDVPAHLKANQR